MGPGWLFGRASFGGSCSVPSGAGPGAILFHHGYRAKRALPQIANMSSSMLSGINDDAVSRSDSIQRVASIARPEAVH